MLEGIRSGYSERALHQESSWVLEQSPKRSHHGMKLLECMKHLDTALRHTGVGPDDACGSLSTRVIL